MRRWGSAALVLALHLLLVLGLRFGLQSGLQRARDKPLALPASIEFFLPPLARQQPAKEKNQEARRPTRISRPTAAASTDATAVGAAPPSLPALTVTPSPPAAAATTDAPRARLILTLPPQAASAPRNPALSDPRTNTARQTLEEKMASALDNTVHEQVQADGTTIRRRVGNECVDLHESRAVQLMPDVDFLRYAPRAAGPSYKCK